MKKIFFTIITICSITSITNQCQNNLNQATKSILENTEKLKEKLTKLQSENNYQHAHLTIDDIQNILITQISQTNSELTETISIRKTSYQKLETITIWFEQSKTIDDWINYFAIHNQMVAAIQKEFEALKTCPQLCQEIGERILSVLKQAINNYSDKTQEMKSLEYVYQDYAQLFQQYK